MMEVRIPEEGDYVTKLEIVGYEAATIIASASVILGAWAGILAVSPGFPLVGPALLISTAVMLVVMDKKFYGDGTQKTWNVLIRLGTCLFIIFASLMFISGRNKYFAKLFPGVQQKFNQFVATMQMEANLNAFLGIIILLCCLRIFEYCFIVSEKMVKFGFLEAFQL